jgi:hypothetical protein
MRDAARAARVARFAWWHRIRDDRRRYYSFARRRLGAKDRLAATCQASAQP